MVSEPETHWLTTAIRDNRDTLQLMLNGSYFLEAGQPISTKISFPLLKYYTQLDFDPRC
jgi:hypothetical protein